MVKTELKDVNVVVECGEPQFAIGSDKIIGYAEIEVCGSCGEPIEKHHKYCSQCGEKVREEVTSSQSSNDDENNGDEKMDIKITYGVNRDGDTIRYDAIPFKENYNERISRFEQSESQRDANKFSIVTYYSNGVSFGESRTFEIEEINDAVIDYLKSVIPHNQMKDDHIVELNDQLDDLVAQEGEFDPYWIKLYKHQTDYTTFQTEDGQVYEIIGQGDKDIDYHHKMIHNVEIEYRGQCPHNMHFWKADILE